MLGPIFLDRDGVINYNRSDYVTTPDEFVFLPGSVEAAARLSQAGRPLFIVSNQACLGKGLLTDTNLARINEKMAAGFAAAGAAIHGIYYCPHLQDDGCDCRKPLPGLMRRAEREHGVRLDAGVMVGDHPRDVAAGAAVGARTVLVLCGQTTAADAEALLTSGRCRPTFVAADLAAAADWILGEQG